MDPAGQVVHPKTLRGPDGKERPRDRAVHAVPDLRGVVAMPRRLCRNVGRFASTG